MRGNLRADMSVFRKNVLVLLTGQVSRVLVQAAYFVLLARVLGVDSYGAFMAAVAVVALAAPFTSLGTNALMVKQVARASDKAARHYFRAVAYTFTGGIFAAVVLALLANLILPEGISPWTFAAIAFADLIGVRLVELSGYVWQALGRSKPLAVLPTTLNLLRLGGITLLGAGMLEVSLTIWSAAYVAATVPFALIVVIVTIRKLGTLSPYLRITWAEIREGFMFSVGIASQNVYNDIDKAMLAKIGDAASAGIYSAAYRIVDMAYTPIRSVAAAAYPLFFSEGESGLRSALRLTSRITPAVVGLSLSGGVAVYVLAPYASFVLGSEYQSATAVIQALAPLLVLRALGFLAADTLMGSGQQGFRAATQIVVAGINVALNFMLIPDYGIMGAVWSSLLCEGVLALVLWARIVFVLRRQRPNRRKMESQESRQT